MADKLRDDGGLVRRRIAEDDGDGGRSSSELMIIRRRIADDGDRGFLDLSLGSIYNNNNNPSVPDVDGFGFSPVPPPPAAPAPAPAPLDVSGMSSGYEPPPAAASGPAFAFSLGLAASAVTGNGDGHVSDLASPVHIPAVVPAVTVPAPAPAVITDAVPPPPSPRAVAASSSAPPAPNKKAPLGRRANATGCGRRRRSGATIDDAAAAADATPTNGGETSPPPPPPPPPFPWATNTAGAHPTLAELTERGITTVHGEVRCRRCDSIQTISYDIRARFDDLSGFILGNLEAMHDRAPPEWMSPALPDCGECGQKGSMRPVIAAEEGRVNWMFLLLGQTLGLCTLEQLKRFCARTRQHRTGAKDRVLFSTYMELCNQLCPGGPFDMASERKNRTRLSA